MAFNDKVTVNIPGADELHDLTLPGQDVERESLEIWNNAQGGEREMVGTEEIRPLPKPPYVVQLVAARDTVQTFKDLQAQGGTHDAHYVRTINGKTTEFSGMSGAVKNVTERQQGGVLVADVTIEYLQTNPTNAA